MALSNHNCSLGLGSNNLRQKGPVWQKACKIARNAILVSFSHPDTFDQFRSCSAVLAEQQGHILSKTSSVIHPLSQFSLYWNTLFAIANLVHMVLSTLRLCYILETSQPRLHYIDDVILGLHVACHLDIAVNFNTGFQESFSSNIVMERQRIACHYLGSWFFPDLISSLPVSYMLLYLQVPYTRCLLFAHTLPIVRAARLRSSLNNIVTFVKVFTRSYIWHRVIHHVLLFAITVHWANCVVYFSPVFSHYWNGQMAMDYHAFFLNSTEGDLTNISISQRYQKALFLCLSSFYGTGVSMYRVYSADEYIVHSVIILYASMFMIYSTVFILNTYMTAYNSVLRYNGVMNQVETYMRRKQFPRQLKERVRLYYDYKYLDRYYKEDSMIDCLSDQLRHEITLHTCHKFVNKIKLFEGLPADVVGAILSHLQPEVYLFNDLVVRAGDIGTCMYFIAYGTVAVYSLKGAEVCHLEDGSHFGAVALMMKDNKRVATVVSIEISHLYRIEDVHFRKHIMANPILRERLEVLAAKRMHETVVTDEAFRRQQLRRQEQHTFATPADSLQDSLAHLQEMAECRYSRG